MRPCVVVKKDWSFSVDQSRVHALKLLVYFSDLLTILLCCNRFARIQEAVMDKTGCRPPYSHHNLLLVQCRFREVLWLLIAVQPLCPTSPAIVEDPLLVARYNSIEKRIIVVAQNERRRHFKTTSCLLFGEFVRHQFAFQFALNDERRLIDRR